MVFPADPGEPVVVFDWQAVRLGPPLVDACIYLGGCLPEAERQRAERDLLRVYHDDLLTRGVTGFTFDDVWQSYRWSVFWGLLLSVSIGMQLERTERGDELFAGMFCAYAQMAQELESEELL
jgi:hypothetical protein